MVAEEPPPSLRALVRPPAMATLLHALGAPVKGLSLSLSLEVVQVMCMCSVWRGSRGASSALSLSLGGRYVYHWHYGRILGQILKDYQR